jgi:hypothetical protein
MNLLEGSASVHPSPSPKVKNIKDWDHFVPLYKLIMKRYRVISARDVFIFENREPWRVCSTLAPNQERSAYECRHFFLPNHK